MNNNEENNDEIKELIKNKETEIKNILLFKINELQNELEKKNNELLQVENIKQAYKNNLELIEERDKDLKIYEEKLDSLTNLLNNKEKELAELNEKYNNIINKKQQKEEYN